MFAFPLKIKAVYGKGCNQINFTPYLYKNPKKQYKFIVVTFSNFEHQTNFNALPFFSRDRKMAHI